MRTAPEIPVTETSGVSECLDRLAAAKWHNRPLSTYRIQFNAGFGFRQARALVGYLHALGITHCYSSPILKARPGSMHGYDIMDHSALNPEVGTEEELCEFAAELKSHGMGHVIDLVPNHMGVGTGTNPWWQDVLENGRSSEFSDFFDIDWNPLRPDLQGKILFPILSDQYGEVLERGDFHLQYENGRFHVQYFDTSMPIDPQTVPLIFEPSRDRVADGSGLRGAAPSQVEAESLADFDGVLAALGNLPSHDSDDPEFAAQRRREAPQLLARLAALVERSAAVKARVERALQSCNGSAGDSRSFDALHRLLEAQAYRMAHWRVSAEEINYRRFFDVNNLIGLRMENPRVFAETHRLVRRLLAEGYVGGLRIDHPDGLLNPAQYFTRLQMLYVASQCGGAEPRGAVADNGIEEEIQRVFGEHDWIGEHAPLFVAVEKILERAEDLPREWPVDGTVGYDFLNLANGILIDGRSERAFTALYRRFTGSIVDVHDLIYQSKKLIMNSAVSGEITVLTHLLAEISSTDRRARDFTRKALGDAIRETIACFPVYRTFIDERGNVTERDRGYINLAIARAKRRNESMPAAVFNFLRDILMLQAEAKNPADSRRRRLHFTLKFQQISGPVMAKGLEDTACYVYNRFVSVNEVGGSPERFAVAVDDFHRGNLERAASWPFSMLTTSTHDTKRSEDVRARLNVLSEMPRAWSAQVLRWRRANRPHRRVLTDGRSVPDANEEYLLYQTLVGVWPFVSSNGRLQLVERVQDYMTKAAHEAKVNLSWVNPNAEYVDALLGFVERVLSPATRGRPNAFLEQIERFVTAVQLFGAMNSLAQVLLKITAPGIPDVYQGNELWDFSLVDPDNRRPVDFDLRQRILGDLDQKARAGNLVQLCRELLADYQTGAVKLWTTSRALCFRRDHGALFQFGSYVPVYGAIEKQEHLCAFARVHEHEMAIIAAPRLAYTLMHGETRPPIGEAWGAAELALPPQAPADFLNVLTGETVKATATRSLLCRELFADFPVALLAGR